MKEKLKLKKQKKNMKKYLKKYVCMKKLYKNYIVSKMGLTINLFLKAILMLQHQGKDMMSRSKNAKCFIKKGEFWISETLLKVQKMILTKKKLNYLENIMMLKEDVKDYKMKIKNQKKVIKNLYFSILFLNPSFHLPYF